ncbi:MAG TPA: universal stress protein [Nitrospira sp.]|nr:universal stress protein [Nitrospira sp.]
MNKTPIGRILAVTDFSECADQAVAYAGFLAATCPAPLDILHVVEIPPDIKTDDTDADRFFEERRKRAERSLVELVGRLASDVVSPRWHQRVGIPSEQVNAAAGELHASLIAVGTHGQTGLPHILLGSTAERVVRGAPCPVLTIRALMGDRQAATSRTALVCRAIRHILCPIDFSQCSVRALEYAGHLIRGLGASLTIFHVLEPVFFDLDRGLEAMPDYERTRAKAESRLAEAREALTKLGLSVQTVITGGIVSDSIVAAVQTERYDLVVMGTHGRRGLPHYMTGCVAEAVLRQAPCPVLTVHREPFYLERLISNELAVSLCT